MRDKGVGSRTPKLTDLGKIFAAIAIVILSVTIVNFLVEVEYIASPRSLIYDRLFIPAMKDLCELTPEDATLVVSTNAPFVTYFTGRTTKVPYGAYSKDSLVDYMRKNGFEYLLVFEGRSQVTELEPLFGAKGLPTLIDSFDLVRTFRTSYNTIHLYQIKSQSAVS